MAETAASKSRRVVKPKDKTKAFVTTGSGAAANKSGGIHRPQYTQPDRAPMSAGELYFRIKNRLWN
jgi:hypothetical protein